MQTANYFIGTSALFPHNRVSTIIVLFIEINVRNIIIHQNLLISCYSYLTRFSGDLVSSSSLEDGLTSSSFSQSISPPSPSVSISSRSDDELNSNSLEKASSCTFCESFLAASYGSKKNLVHNLTVVGPATLRLLLYIDIIYSNFTHAIA